MANHLYKLWYQFSDSTHWTGPMFFPGTDSDDCISYMKEKRPELTYKVTGRWRQDGNRFK